MCTTIFLRKATLKDARLLFDWRNDDECRRNSFHSNRVEWDEHLGWLSRQLGDIESKIYICEDSGCKIGQIRLTPYLDGYLISYSVAREYRSKGYGKLILILVESKVRELDETVVLYAQVKYSNEVSQLLFEQLGYDKNELQNYIEYRKGVWI